MRILVLGAYGLIGLAISRRLLQEGYNVTGLARSARKGRSLLPDADWIAADLSTLTEPDRWRAHLDGVDAVVNASGLLQAGLQDDIVRVQRDSIIALVAACEAAGVGKFIQISAPGAASDSDTLFYRSKAAADSVIRNSHLEWTIFRPGLVLSAQSYGGTSLLRMLAAFPFVQPVVLANSRIQTVSADDVADAVADAVGGRYPGRDFDLVEAHSHTLESVVLRVRAWLGFGQPVAVIRLPRVLGRAVSLAADVAGWLGWRSALRTTSLKVLAGNVSGDGRMWERASGRPLRSLEDTLRGLPSTVQERVYGRAQLVFPVLLLVLAGFWIGSGIHGLIDGETVSRFLTYGFSADVARLAVSVVSALGISVGTAMLIRPLVRPACAVSIALSIVYLIGTVLSLPGWRPGLSSMVCLFTAIALSLAVAALAEER